MPDLSTLLMIVYLAALFLRNRPLWIAAGMLAALSLVLNLIAFVAFHSFGALLNSVFCMIIAWQATGYVAGFDPFRRIRDFFRRRR